MLTPAKSALLLAALIFNAASLTTAAPATEANEQDIHLRSAQPEAAWARHLGRGVKEDAQGMPVQKREEKSAKLASRDSDTFGVLSTTGRTFFHVHTKDMPNGVPVVSGEVMSGDTTRFSSVTIDDGHRRGCRRRRHGRCSRRFRHRYHHKHCGCGGHHHHRLESHGQHHHDQDSTGEHHHHHHDESASNGSWRELDEQRDGADEHNHPNSHLHHHHSDERENLRETAQTDHAAEVEGHERDHQPHQDKRVQGHNERGDHGSHSPASLNATVSHPPHETHPSFNARG